MQGAFKKLIQFFSNFEKEMPNPKRQRQDDSENIDELLRRVEEDMVTVGNKDDRSLRPRSKVQADDVSVFQKYVGGTAKCNWKGKWMPVTIEGIDDGEDMAIIEWTIDGKPGRVEWWQLKDLCPPVHSCFLLFFFRWKLRFIILYK